MNGKISDDLKRDLFIFHDEKNKRNSNISRVFGSTILDQVFDQLDPNKKTLRQILEEIRNEIKTGGEKAIVFPVTSVNNKTGDVVLSKFDIGLDKVDNTSDNMKPMSVPQRETLMTILRNYKFHINLDKYDKHILDTDNPHDVSVSQLDKDHELTNFVEKEVAKRLYYHSKNRSLYVHKDIREAIKNEKIRIDELQEMLKQKLVEMDHNDSELFKMTTQHDIELSKREILKNKVNVFTEEINNNHQLYPSTRAVIEYMEEIMKRMNLISRDTVISDIKVIGSMSELPKASKAVYRFAYVIQRGRGNKVDVAICRREGNIYYWDINDIGAYSKYDMRYFIDTSEGLSLNLQNIFNAITQGEGLLQEIYSTEGKNVLSGFNGYTFSSDENHSPEGEVDTILFSVPFKVVKAGKPTVSIKGNWRAKMGDGSLIDLYDPIIYGVTNSTASIQFRMRNSYPSNSPSVLVFNNSDSKIIIDGTLNDALLNDAGIGFERYSIGGDGFDILSGFYGLTVEATPPDTNGEVNKAIITIPFKRYKKAIPKVKINGSFKLKMGDGSFINLISPTVIDTTLNSVTFEFTMESTYPSNSPCMLVYANEDSIITVTGDDQVKELEEDKKDIEYFKPIKINASNRELPSTGGNVEFSITFDVFNKDKCDCPANFLTFGNIRSINIIPGTMDGNIRYYVNGDMGTMKEVRIEGLKSMAFQEFLIDHNFPDNIIVEKHLGNRIISSRTIQEGAVLAHHITCERDHIIGNISSTDTTAQEISLPVLADRIKSYFGGSTSPSNPLANDGQEMILSPHLWTPNTVYNLQDQSLGMRFKGTTSVLQNMELTILLSEEINMKHYQLIDAGGSWFYSTNPNAQAILGGSNITGFTFATIIIKETGLYFTSISTGNRYDAPYDIWVRFCDPTKVG